MTKKKNNKKNANKRTNYPAAVSYKTKNVSMTGTIRKNAIQNLKKREFVTNITPNGSGVFALVESLPIQPGNAKLFPFLSTIAAGFEQYRINSLALVYEPTCATNTAGALMIAPDYNPDDYHPDTDDIMMTYQDAYSGSPYDDVRIQLDVDAMHAVLGRKYTRVQVEPSSRKWFDCGNVFVAHIGVPAQTVGKLFVEYNIDLFVPKREPDSTFIASTANKTRIAKAADQNFTTTVPAQIAFDQVVLDGLQGGTLTGGSFYASEKGKFNVKTLLNFYDNNVENFDTLTTLKKNGVGVDDDQSSTNFGGMVRNIIDHIIELEPGDYIDLETTLTGAAGALSMIAADSYMSIIPV
jgi:hypothetical protein